ncbi:MAG: aminotransferase yhxA [Solibacillus sp.]
MEKTKKLMVGISATALTLSLAGCNSSANSLPPQPTDVSCNDWDWSEENGVWQCDESRSGHYRSYYYGGGYYNNKSALHSNNDYQNYKSSASFKTGQSSSGFGSGSKSFGG